MADDYKAVKSGGLKLKGKKKIFKSSKLKKAKKEEEQTQNDPDAESHGGWWIVNDEVDLKGGIHIALECGDGSKCYLAALDNGKFTIGGPHLNGEEPNPEEVFALTKTPDETKWSIKTGFGRYIGVDHDGQLIATAEAIGSKERFVAVFQDGKTAIQAVCNQLFLSMKTDKEGHVYVASRKASEDEMINIRTNAKKVGPIDWRADEDKKKAKECESAYVKMYQHSKVDLKGRHVSIDINDRKAVKRAQNEGDLHDLLLHRRTKMKSDRYC